MVMVRKVKRPQTPLVGAFEGALGLLDAEESGLKRRMTEIQSERKVLEAAIARARNQPPSPWVTHWNVTDGGELQAEHADVKFEVYPAPSDVNIVFEDVAEDGTFTDMVVSVLERATGPMSPKDIADVLARAGFPQEDTTKVRGAISYLSRQGRVYARRRGAWVLKGSPADQADEQDQVMVDLVPEDTETPTADAEGVSEGDETTPQEGGSPRPANRWLIPASPREGGE